MDPDLPVLDGVPEVFEIKFICKGAAVMLKTASDFDSLFWGKEFGRGGIVMHYPECQDC